MKKAFVGLSVTTVGDFLQLPPVLGTYIFSPFSEKDSMEHSLGLQFWHLFKYAELTRVVRQNDKLFIDMLNKVRVGIVDDDVEQLLRARFVCDSYENYYPIDALLMHAENEPAIGKNETVLSNLPGELIYTIEADDRIPDNYKYLLTMILAAQNQEQASTGGLAKLLKLKAGTKIMLKVNIDIQID